MLAALAPAPGCGGQVDEPTPGAGVAGSAGASGGAGQAGAPQIANLTEACRLFFKQQKALVDGCRGLLAHAGSEEGYVTECAALAALPGVTSTIDSIVDCATQVEQQSACAWPSCVAAAHLMPAGTGTRTRGEACQSGLQCASGECSADAGGAPACGVCLELRRPGESCGQPDQRCENHGQCEGGVCQDHGPKKGDDCTQYGADPCGPLLRCATSEVDGLYGVCQPRPALGEACDIQAQIGCLPGQFCKDGVCTKQQPEGASCGAGTECESASFCHEGTCQRQGTGAGPGEACDFHHCGRDLVCSPSLTCIAAVPAGLGASCQVHPCGPGLVCGTGYVDPATKGVCVKAPEVGQPCVDLQCGEGAYCSDAKLPQQPGVCRAPGRQGEACPCQGGLRCDGDVCRAPEGCP